MFHFYFFLLGMMKTKIHHKSELILVQQINTTKIIIREGMDERNLIKTKESPEKAVPNFERNFQKKDLLDFLLKSTNSNNVQQQKLNRIESQQYLFNDWESTSVYKPKLKSGLQSEFDE